MLPAKSPADPALFDTKHFSLLQGAPVGMAPGYGLRPFEEKEIPFIYSELELESMPAGSEDLPDSAGQSHAMRLIYEKLQMAIEELRSSNKELEAANQELRLVNEELKGMQGEIEVLTRELTQVSERYAHTLDQMPYAVALVDANGKIQFWNAAAQRLFKLGPDSLIGLDLDQIPVQQPLRQAIARKYRAVLEGGASVMLRNKVLEVNSALHRVNVHFASLNPAASADGVLVMFVRPSAPDPVLDLGDLPNFMDGAAS